MGESVFLLNSPQSPLPRSPRKMLIPIGTMFAQEGALHGQALGQGPVWVADQPPR